MDLRAISLHDGYAAALISHVDHRSVKSLRDPDHFSHSMAPCDIWSADFCFDFLLLLLQCHKRIVRIEVFICMLFPMPVKIYVLT